MLLRMERPAIFTAIFGGYDDLRDQPECPGVDYICFTDDPELSSEQWRVQLVEPRFPNPRLSAKWFKLLPHLALPGYRYTIWIDGGIQILVEDFAVEILSFMTDTGFLLFRHPARTSVRDEVAELRRLGRFPDQPFEEQAARYRREGFQDDLGLFAATVIARDSYRPAVRSLGERWMNENLQGTFRDQLSLPYLLWRMQIRPDVIPYDLWNNHLLTMVPHNDT